MSSGRGSGDLALCGPGKPTPFTAVLGRLRTGGAIWRGPPDVAAPWGECRSEGAVPAPIGAPAARTRDCTNRGPTPASRERVLLSALLLAAIGSQLAVLSTLLRSMSSARRVRMGRPGSMIEEVFVATADRSRPGPLSPGTDQSTVMTMSSRASFRDEPHRRTNAHPARPGRRLPTFIDSKQPGPLPPASEQRSREAPTSERHASARSIVSPVEPSVVLRAYARAWACGGPAAGAAISSG